MVPVHPAQRDQMPRVVILRQPICGPELDAAGGIGGPQVAEQLQERVELRVAVQLDEVGIQWVRVGHSFQHVLRQLGADDGDACGRLVAVGPRIERSGDLRRASLGRSSRDKETPAASSASARRRVSSCRSAPWPPAPARSSRQGSTDGPTLPSKDRGLAKNVAMPSILDTGGTFGLVCDSQDEMSGTLTDRLPISTESLRELGLVHLLPRPVLFPEGAQAPREDLTRILDRSPADLGSSEVQQFFDLKITTMRWLIGAVMIAILLSLACVCRCATRQLA